VVDLYVPNGKAPGTPKFEYKLEWLRRLRAHLDEDLSPDEEVVLLGDINIAPDDRDVYDPVALEGTIHCSEPEREALRNLLDWGLSDALRLHTDEPGLFSWWDYRAAMFRRGLGLRIDLIMVTRPLADRCRAVEIDKRARGGEKPSDHAPVLATFE
jgi:exodeoxyribonuclease-3